MAPPKESVVARTPPNGMTVSRRQISVVGAPKRAPMVGKSASTLVAPAYSALRISSRLFRLHWKALYQISPTLSDLTQMPRRTHEPIENLCGLSIHLSATDVQLVRLAARARATMFVKQNNSICRQIFSIGWEMQKSKEMMPDMILVKLQLFKLDLSQTISY